MSLVAALILGIVQGLTEFLPISSSGHLVTIPWALGIDEPTLAFATSLHLGTLAGVLFALAPEVRLVARTITGWGHAGTTEKMLVKLLVIGTIPAGIIGLGFEALVGDAFESPVLAALLLGVTGLVLTSTEHRIEETQVEPTRTTVTTRDAWIVGTAQAVAVLPGISRSGMTIAAGMRLGLSRQAIARFSFLLSIPAIAGAVVVETPALVKEGALSDQLAAVGLGILAAAVAGFWSLRWFLGILDRVGLRPFGRYCYAAAAVLLFIAMARG